MKKILKGFMKKILKRFMTKILTRTSVDMTNDLASVFCLTLVNSKRYNSQHCSRTFSFHMCPCDPHIVVHLRHNLNRLISCL